MKFLRNNSICWLITALFLPNIFSCGIPEATRVLPTPEVYNSQDSFEIGFEMPDDTDIDGYYVYYKFYPQLSIEAMNQDALYLDPNSELYGENSSLTPGSIVLQRRNFFNCTSNINGSSGIVVQHNPGDTFTIRYQPNNSEKLLFSINGSQATWTSDGNTQDLYLKRFCPDDSYYTASNSIINYDDFSPDNYLTFNSFQYDGTLNSTSESLINNIDDDLESIIILNDIQNSPSPNIAISFAVYAYHFADNLQAEVSIPVFIGYFSQFKIGDSDNDR